MNYRQYLVRLSKTPAIKKSLYFTTFLFVLLLLNSYYPTFRSRSQKATDRASLSDWRYADYFDSLKAPYLKDIHLRLLNTTNIMNNCTVGLRLGYRWRAAGFGSELAVMAHAFSVALTTGRVVNFQGLPWFSNNTKCANATGHAAWTCWFLPISNCFEDFVLSKEEHNCTDGWIHECKLNSIFVYHHFHQEKGDSLYNSSYDINFYQWRLGDVMYDRFLPPQIELFMSQPEHLPEWRDRWMWWRAVVVSWLLRPTVKTFELVKARVQLAFPSGVPPLIFVHIRGTDKNSEMDLKNASVYFDKILELKANHSSFFRASPLANVRDILVNTEDIVVYQQLVNETRMGAAYCYNDKALKSSEERVACMKRIDGLCDQLHSVCWDWSYYTLHFIPDKSRYAYVGEYINVVNIVEDSEDLMITVLAHLEVALRYAKALILTTRSNWSATIEYMRIARQLDIPVVDLIKDPPF